MKYIALALYTTVCLMSGLISRLSVPSHCTSLSVSVTLWLYIRVRLFDRPSHSFARLRQSLCKPTPACTHRACSPFYLLGLGAFPLPELVPAPRPFLAAALLPAPFLLVVPCLSAFATLVIPRHRHVIPRATDQSNTQSAQSVHCTTQKDDLASLRPFIRPPVSLKLCVPRTCVASRRS